MRHIVLPVMTVLTVVAGAAGLLLGESTLAQIDPIHFQNAPPPPRDVSGNHPPPGPLSGYAQGASWQQGYEARAADCRDCLAPFAAPAQAAAGSAYGDALIPDGRPEQAADAFADAFEATPAPETPQLARYLHYPVSLDQGAATASPAEQPPAASAPAPEPVGL